jgi:hypothetical protein
MQLNQTVCCNCSFVGKGAISSPKHEGDMFLRETGIHLPVYTQSQLGRTTLSSSALRGRQLFTCVEQQELFE